MASRALAPGDVLDGKWRIEAELGRGGMGSVYAAAHVRNQRKVAIKVLHEELARDPEQRERLQREGYASNRVEHPGIVSVLDDGITESGACYLVMERLEGCSLDELAESRGGALPLSLVLDLGARWLEVVAAAHRVGVVHRDLKPENVFVTRDGALKVLDFGLASVRDERARRRLTETGVPMGTPAFMPPEQALALWEEVDARSDVYALGASLFTLLTGRLVHEARTGPELLVKVSTRQADPVATLAPEIPEPLARVLDRALRFRGVERFADAEEMRAELLRAAESIAASPVAPIPVPSTPRPALPNRSLAFEDEPTQRDATMSPITRPQPAPRRGARPLLGAAVVLAAALGCAALAWLLRSPASPVPERPTAAASTSEGLVDDAPPAFPPLHVVPPTARPVAAPSGESAAASTQAVASGAKAVPERPRGEPRPSAGLARSSAPASTATAVPAEASDPMGWK